MDHLTIETPEQIPLEFLLAGIGSRFLALALDSLIQGAATVLLVVAGLLIASGSGISHGASKPGGQTWTMALLVLLFFLVQVGYFAFFEALWNGQTPGKRYMHLRVIKDSGRPVTTFDALGRNLLRLVDSLPGIYAVAIVSALLSAKNKRLGDYVAGTVVVHEKPLSAEADLHWESAPRATLAPPLGSVLKLIQPVPPPQPGAGASLDSGYDVSRLTPEEFHLLETFLLRRRHLAAGVRMQMARQIIERIATKLEISEDDRRNPEGLIERLANSYRRRGHLR
jgi:uncharacterized RDD family membrane protein YckC